MDRIGNEWLSFRLLVRMNRCGFYISVLVCLAGLSAGGAHGQDFSPWYQPQYVYKVWDNKNGLPQNTVFDLALDEDGYLWLATEEGLLRFDGGDFKIIEEKNTPGLSNSFFISISSCSRGGIWAATESQVLLTANGSISILDLNHYISDAKITGIEEDSDGILWIGTSSGRLFMLREGTVSELMSWKEAGFGAIQELLAVDDDLLVGTDKGLFRINKAGHPVRLPEFDNMNIRSIAYQGSSVWVGTREHGLFHLLGGKSFRYTEKDGLNEQFVNSLSVDRDGRVWIGTSGSGLQVLENGVFTDLAEAGFSNNDIKVIFHTAGGLIWLGTSGSGLIRMKRAKIQTLDSEHGLSAPIALAVYQDQAGDIWIGTAGKGLNRVQGGKIKHFKHKDGLANEIILSIGGAPDALYIGTARGLNRLHLPTGKIDRHWTEIDGLASNIVQAVFYDSQERLWIGTRSGGIHKLTEDGAIERVELPEKFSSAEFISIFEDRNKTVWFGSNGNGMLSISNSGDVRSYTLNQGLTSNMINCFYEDSEGTLWMGTEAGLIVYFKNQFRVYDSSNGLNFNGIFRILPDHQENVWLSGNFGLQRIAINDLINLKHNSDSGAMVVVQHYGTPDGMKNAEAVGGIFPAGYKMRNGELWFPSVEGVAIVHPGRMHDGNKMVNIRIEGIQYGNVEKTILKDIEVPAGVYNIEIAYTSINFTTPESVNYFYRLAMLEEEWVNAGNRKTGYFTSLDPGEYTFEVRAEQNGIWSETTSFNFVVLPFFYQTTWFWALLFVFFIAAGFFIKGYYAKYQQGSKLKALVDDRTAELLRMNEKLQIALASIEDQNQKLLQIAWTQSHVVRAPLARMLGLLDLIQNYHTSGLELKELLTLLEKSGSELDLIIRDIVKQSETVKRDMGDGIILEETAPGASYWLSGKNPRKKK